MKTSILIAGSLALSLLGTGCATKKYVAQTIAPVEARVTTAEAKNTEQDTKITANASQIDSVDKDLSRTKERLTDEAKAQLDSFVQSLDGVNRYIVEIQGFTDKTGSPVYNDELSQERAQAVARYLASHKVPLRNITMLGTGVADGDQRTREERAQGRKVDVRVYVPEI